jgi:hypothetical protein
MGATVGAAWPDGTAMTVLDWGGPTDTWIEVQTPNGDAGYVPGRYLCRQPPVPPVLYGCCCPQGCTTPPPGCFIKGNVSFTSGENLYHVPGGKWYDATVIDPRYGERWFCTEAEAVANGWRRSSE